MLLKIKKSNTKVQLKNILNHFLISDNHPEIDFIIKSFKKVDFILEFFDELPYKVFVSTFANDDNFYISIEPIKRVA